MARKHKYKQYGIVDNGECWVVFNRENGNFLYIDYDRAQEFIGDFFDALQEKR